MAKPKTISGRRHEKATLGVFLESNEAEFLAIYGRRRVGKTHLIREYCRPRSGIYFELSGQKDAPRSLQLHHFKRELEETFYSGAPLPELKSWEAALSLLCDAVDRKIKQGIANPIVIFLDELPWLATPQSRLVQALDHYWNARLCRIPAVRLVACGSAASWMLDRLIHAKGGLHNRISRRIRLEPFSLFETREYLRDRMLALNYSQIIELYMAFGGVPHYLKQANQGRSAAQNIAAACFDRSGILFDEFPRLFASLYADSEEYERTVRAIAKKRQGILRRELIRSLRATSGGRLKKRLENLEEAGFITSLKPYGKKSKNTAYRLIDEYTAFYLKWIERAPKGILAGGAESYWLSKSQTPGYRSWAGYAFEGICLKHAQHIKDALGISGIAAEVGSWRHVPNKKNRNDKGAQIDLLFDRADGVINLCEVKYTNELFQVSKQYAAELKQKISIFEKKTRTRKNVFLTLVTTHGLKKNTWSEGLISNVVTMKSLFVK